jgi:hypothetical protein
MMPPSPSLSARMISVTEVNVTMIVTDQKINEMIPYTLSVLTARMRVARAEHGLDGVDRAGADIPKTTPSAPISTDA